MFVLGLILVVLASLLLLAAVLGGADDGASFDLGGLELSGLNVAAVFLGGALTMLMLVLGLVTLRLAVRSAAARRRESKELQKVSAKLEQREAELRRERGDHTATEAKGEGDSADRDPSTRQDPPPRSP